MSRPRFNQWTASGEYPGYQLRVCNTESGTLRVEIRKDRDSPPYSFSVPSEVMASAEELNEYVAEQLAIRIADMESVNG